MSGNAIEAGLEQRLAAYLAQREPGVEGLEISDLARIHGGSSQETFRYAARWRDAGGEHHGRFVLRRTPVSGLVNGENDLEYRVYSALAGAPLPVPHARFLELDPQWLDRPFFVMDMAPGEAGHFFGSDDPYQGKSTEVARAFWTHLGTLAAQPVSAPQLSSLRGAGEAEGHWRRELAHWEAILTAGEAVPEPIVHGAIRWLRRNPPREPEATAIVHGDYRSGNFLFLPDGTISAILDWEMCHLGDPLEDVAWALDPMWSMERHLPLEEGLALWEAASGRRLDRAALEWWRLFAAVKACTLWTSAEKSFEEGESREMIVALTGMRAGHFHRKVILAHMERHGAMT